MSKIVITIIVLITSYLLYQIVSPSPCNKHCQPKPTVEIQTKKEVSKVIKRKNETNYFSFKIPASFKTKPYSKALKAWRKSLIKNLGYQDAKINSEVFLQTDISLEIDDNTTEKKIYQSHKNPNRFYVLSSSVIVDFSTSQVGTMGVSGVSLHLTPSKKMMVILAPAKHINLLGVLLSYGKTELPSAPIFDEKQVNYYWHDWGR